MILETNASSNPLRQRLRRLDIGQRIAEAESFIAQFHRENELDDAACRARIREARRDLERAGHYDHTPEELAFGARVAWRNHARCIGRLFWKSLEVHDCRDIADPAGIASRMVDHMVGAHGDGRIRSTISVFAPVRGDELPAHVESRQIAQYAGHLGADGRIVGDPVAVEATRAARALGWKGPSRPGMFDLLPIVICDARGRRHLFELPKGAVQEVEIAHPALPGVAELGLRWYTVPCVSSMIMTIGGIEYPCAPFNGFYMASEIASRNFVDETRYALLRPLARAMQIRESDPLWKDRVVTELNAAVLHSFRDAGATILDHHTASEQFMDFVQKETAAGRTPSGEWSWIVPPQASSVCPVYHLPMQDRNLVPNYYSSRSTDGARLGIGAPEVSRCPVTRSIGRIGRAVSGMLGRRAAGVCPFM
ncbi:MAG: nitric oxide synthase oxygenase [Planctomycetota bacterium]